jgi:hypothetical protein
LPEVVLSLKDSALKENAFLELAVF